MCSMLSMMALQISTWLKATNLLAQNAHGLKGSISNAIRLIFISTHLRKAVRSRGSSHEQLTN